MAECNPVACTSHVHANARLIAQGFGSIRFRCPACRRKTFYGFVSCTSVRLATPVLNLNVVAELSARNLGHMEVPTEGEVPSPCWDQDPSCFNDGMASCFAVEDAGGYCTGVIWLI